MHVRVLFFARARELAGLEELELVLEPGAAVRDVVREVRARLPEVADYLSTCRIAVNEEFRGLNDAIPAGANVAIIPPVSGGVGNRPRPEARLRASAGGGTLRGSQSEASVQGSVRPRRG